MGGASRLLCSVWAISILDISKLTILESFGLASFAWLDQFGLVCDSHEEITEVRGHDRKL